MVAPAARTIDIGYRPRAWQLHVHEQIARHRFSVPVVHRRGGKTVMSIVTLIDAALRFQGGDGRFGYIAPYLKQAKQNAWDYLVRYASAIPGATITQSDLSVRFPNGSVIRLFGADNPDAIRGLYFDGVVMDEVAQMKKQTWGEVVRPALADRKGWAVFIGTPKGMDYFYELHLEATKSEKTEWYTDIFPAARTKVLDEDELRSAAETMSEAQVRQEFGCDFSASTDDILITIDLVTAAAQRVVPRESLLAGLPKVIGVDVARQGDDRSVIQKRWGPVAFQPMQFKNVDNMTLVAHVARELHQWSPDACFIDSGAGHGVIDRLRQLGHQVIEVNFGATATDAAHYENKRIEMWDTARMWLEHGGILPDCPELKRDLVIPTYDFNPVTNRKRLEKKDSIKKRSVSPDCGDAFALTFAYPVKPKGFRMPVRQSPPRGMVVKEYDPYSNL